MSMVFVSGFDIIKSSNKPRFEREDFIMATIILKDWYYDNCVTYPVSGNWFLNWGVAVVENATNKTVGAYRTLKGEIVNETEKAIRFKCKAMRFDNRCNITKSVDWFMWLPKKGLINDKVYSYFDGGQGQYVDRCMLNFLHTHTDYTSVKTWAFK